MQLVLLASGFHYFWTRLQRDPVPRLYPQVVTVSIMFADLALFAIVPLALILSPTIVGADYYATVDRPAGAAGLGEDQVVGAGIIFWALGDLASIPFLLLALAQWARRDQAEAAEIDHQLDALEAHPTGEAGGQPHRSRLWWEDDPALAEHFHWRRHDRR